MNKTTAIAMIAALSAAAMIPASSAGSVNARTFFDVAAGVEFGQGAGVYDPAGPDYCAALLSFYAGVSPVLFYYTTPVRYQPAVALSHLEQVGGPAPGAVVTGCAGEVPNAEVYVDLVEVDAGSAVWSLNLLGLNEVANLGQTTVEFEYCNAPTVSAQGPGGLVLPDPTGGPDLEFFTARWAECRDLAGNNDEWRDSDPVAAGQQGYTLYDGAGACFVFTMTTAVGSLDGDQPIFLVDGQSCNTLVGSGSSNTAVSLASPVTGNDYVAQHCVSTVTTDVTDGTVDTTVADSDFFVAGHFSPAGTLGLLDWATTTGLPPRMFENVANLEADQVSPTCFD